MKASDAVVRVLAAAAENFIHTNDQGSIEISKKPYPEPRQLYNFIKY